MTSGTHRKGYQLQLYCPRVGKVDPIFRLKIDAIGQAFGMNFQRDLVTEVEATFTFPNNVVSEVFVLTLRWTTGGVEKVLILDPTDDTYWSKIQSTRAGKWITEADAIRGAVAA